MTEPESWDTIKSSVRRRDDHTCQRCGSKGEESRFGGLHVHHIIPRVEGGSDDLDNLVTLCARCHSEIHTDGTQDEPARLTGDEFWEWIDEYDGPPKEPWQARYTCVNCGYEWVGKPVAERSSSLTCQKCRFGGGYIGIEVGEVFLQVGSAESIADLQDSINYTGVEFKTPIAEFTPTSLLEVVQGERSIIAFAETNAECFKCGTGGARQYTVEFRDDSLEGAVADTHLLCDQCREDTASREYVTVERP